MKKWFLILFTIAACLEMIFILFAPENRLFTKPLLMIFLLAYFVTQEEAPNKLMIVALVFAWLGDLFMMVTLEWGFTAGLASFLIMQILYCIIFYKQTSMWLKQDTLFALFVSCYIAFMLYLLVPKAGDMLAPVIVYALVFGLVAIIAFWRHKAFNGWLKLLCGVLIFVISDSIIGINKFVYAVPKADFWIMLTYIIGQYLIVKGYIESKQLKTATN